MRIRLFSKRLDPRLRRLYRSLLLFYILVTLALIWPLATLFSRVRPIVFGMPFSLFSIAALIVMSFSVLLVLFIWEGRTGNSCDPTEDEARPADNGEQA